MRKAFAAVVVLLATMQPAAAEDVDYDSLNESTKDAIKTACHGWIFLDAANWIAEWFDAVSPLCDAEEQARLRGLVQPPAPAPTPRVDHGPDYTPTDFGSRADPWAFVRIECENEYMCVRQRIRAIEAGRTVSMDEYSRIAAKCQGEYWCIEQAFDKLPDLEVPPPPEPQQSGAAETPPAEVKTSVEATAPEAQAGETQAAQAQAPKQPTATAVPRSPGAAVEVGQRLPDGVPGIAPAAGTTALFTAEASISGVAADDRETRVTYTNLSPVALFLGPVLFDMTCSDGSRGPAWVGGMVWLAPGESVTRVGDAESIYGQSCPGGLAAATPAGPVRHLQKGISGYEEQSARCSATRTVALVFVMAPPGDGQHYLFLTGDGQRIAVEAGAYDAKRVLGDICGGARALSASAGGSDYVAGADVYLSRDYRNFMDAWAAECARPGIDCASAYADWTAKQPH